MTTPHLNQVIELRDGTNRRAMVYRIQHVFKALQYLPALYLLSVVTVTGEKIEVYL